MPAEGIQGQEYVNQGASCMQAGELLLALLLMLVCV